ncbi:MAG: hypothetical protein R2861_12460 [Desulfobacterales bacterium]
MPYDKAYHPVGGLAVLFWQPGSPMAVCVVKQSAVVPEMMVH